MPHKTVNVKCVLDKSRLKDILIESLGLKTDALAVRDVDLEFLDQKLVISYQADFEIIGTKNAQRRSS